MDFISGAEHAVEGVLEEVEEILHIVPPKPKPVTVAHEGPIRSKKEVADFGAYQTTVFTGVENPQQFLPYDDKRSEVRVRVVWTGGAAPSNPPASVWFGSPAQLQGPQKQGYQLFAGGGDLVIQNKQAVWFVPDGTNAVTVTAIVQRFSGGTGSSGT